jgi:hypothetical protein
VNEEIDKFLILIKPHGTGLKPQQKTLRLPDRNWEIEWSTASAVSMTIDFFNLTVGRVLSSGGERKIEECWRVTHVPGYARKVRYGVNLPETTSTSAKPLADGLYLVKLTGMSIITEGLHVESGVGAAIVRLTVGSPIVVEETAQHDSTPAGGILGLDKGESPVKITSKTVLRYFNLSEEDDEEKD